MDIGETYVVGGAPTTRYVIFSHSGSYVSTGTTTVSGSGIFQVGLFTKEGRTGASNDTGLFHAASFVYHKLTDTWWVHHGTFTEIPPNIGSRLYLGSRY